MTTIILPISDSLYKKFCSGETCYMLRDKFPNVSVPFKIVLVRKKDSGRSIISRVWNDVHAGVVMGECYCEDKELYSFMPSDDCLLVAYKVTKFKRATKYRTVKDLPKSYKIVEDDEE